MIRHDEINRIISESGYKKSYIAKKIGVRGDKLSRLLNGRQMWNTDDITAFKAFFSLSAENIDRIFFADKVDR